MNRQRMTKKEKIEICEVVAFLGIVAMFIAGFSAWIFGAPADYFTKPLGVIGLAAFLLGAWRGGCFR